MYDDISPLIDTKVQRHCEFDTFVSRVDKRMKHSSGLAIHRNVENVPNETVGSRQMKPMHKSKFYRQQVREMKERIERKPEPDRNLLAKKEVENELLSRLRQYQKRQAKGEFSFIRDIGVIDCPPDPKLMARFRYPIGINMLDTSGAIQYNE